MHRPVKEEIAAKPAGIVIRGHQGETQPGARFDQAEAAASIVNRGNNPGPISRKTTSPRASFGMPVCFD